MKRLNIAGVITVMLCFIGGVHMQRRRRRPPPLPTLTSVGVETGEGGEAHVRVFYVARRTPDFQWYIDGIALPPNENTATHREDSSGSSVSMRLPDGAGRGRRVSLCLYDRRSQICLTLRPLTQGGLTQEDQLHFPWPRLVPSPRVRYDPGARASVFAPVLETDHPYSYNATFIGRPNPTPSRSSITVISPRDMEGGTEGDVVTITPVATGWMINVATDEMGWEGVLLVNTLFRPTSGLVESCTSERYVNIYMRQNRGPFPPHFTATVPRHQAVTCLQGSACLVMCPFVRNGDVTATLMRRREMEHVYPTAEADESEDASPVFRPIKVWRWGKYYREAVFELPQEEVAGAAGNYMCHVSSKTHSATMYTTLTVMP